MFCSRRSILVPLPSTGLCHWSEQSPKGRWTYWPAPKQSLPEKKHIPTSAGEDPFLKTSSFPVNYWGRCISPSTCVFQEMPWVLWAGHSQDPQRKDTVSDTAVKMAPRLAPKSGCAVSEVADIAASWRVPPRHTSVSAGPQSVTRAMGTDGWSRQGCRWLFWYDRHNPWNCMAEICRCHLPSFFL